MNKIISLLVLFFLGLSFNVFAEDLSSLRANKVSASATSKKTLRAAAIPSTDIHIANLSNQPFSVKVPGTSINDIVLPGEVEDIYSDVYFNAIHIQLLDRYGVMFFDDYVSNHSMLKVKDYPLLNSAQGSKQGARFQVIKE